MVSPRPEGPAQARGAPSPPRPQSEAQKDAPSRAGQAPGLPIELTPGPAMPRPEPRARGQARTHATPALPRREELSTRGPSETLIPGTASAGRLHRGAPCWVGSPGHGGIPRTRLGCSSRRCPPPSGEATATAPHSWNPPCSRLGRGRLWELLELGLQIDPGSVCARPSSSRGTLVKSSLKWVAW
ncbi:translation initiation factor IF-2-like [Choloepus didactylus]|uniref:translation initiation factor IF-2-like n=1 Tax=Choloepus didactylus TaxID=27675 RepID=UPI0018A0CCE4|nr:translation initiation factor IF-2-like [Choloepus didactylus]